MSFCNRIKHTSHGMIYSSSAFWRLDKHLEARAQRKFTRQSSSDAEKVGHHQFCEMPSRSAIASFSSRTGIQCCADVANRTSSIPPKPILQKCRRALGRAHHHLSRGEHVHDVLGGGVGRGPWVGDTAKPGGKGVGV